MRPPVLAALSLVGLFVFGLFATGGDIDQRATLTPAPTVYTPPTPPAVVTATPTRGTQVQVTATLPPPTTLDPTDGLTGCDLMAYYRAEAGLPRAFDRVGWHESRCRNTVSSWCCHGYFQIHRLWVPELGHCGVHRVDDLLGATPRARAANACAAAHVYSVQGGRAWETWGWA